MRPYHNQKTVYGACGRYAIIGRIFFLAQNVNLSFILFCTVLNQEEGPLIHYSKLPDSKGPIIPQVLGSRPR